jgi:hypothetical protein
LTYLHVDQAVEMASRTYDMLKDFIAKHPDPTHAIAPSGLTKAEIEGEVRSFAQLETGEQKKAWLLSHGFQEDDAKRIAAEVSLPRTLRGGAHVSRASSPSLVISLPELSESAGDSNERGHLIEVQYRVTG